MKFVNSLKQHISEYVYISLEIKKLEEKRLKVLHTMLSYELPQGKYKGMTLKEVFLRDQHYAEWWINSNLPNEENDCFYDITRLSYLLHNIAKGIHASELRKKEEEIEAQRAEYCKRTNQDYQLDYKIRHNINLRDWGM